MISCCTSVGGDTVESFLSLSDIILITTISSGGEERKREKKKKTRLNASLKQG